MAKPTAPLLSFHGSGSIAKTLVYASWRGRNYVRQHVIPSNPRTTSQTTTRNVFTNLQEIYKRMSPTNTEVWDDFTKGQPLTSRNAFTQFNLPSIKVTPTFTGWVASPGTRAGLPFATAAVTSPSAGVARLTWTAPTPPTGWTVVQAVLTVILQGDMSMLTFDPRSFEAAGASSPLNLSSLATGTYVWSAFLEWVRPDGQLATGPSVTGTQAVA